MDVARHIQFDASGSEGCHRFRHEAMATTFEIFVSGEEKGYARQAADTAFRELDRIEQRLSRYRENSDISRINGLTSENSVRVGPMTIDCLMRCRELWKETGGAFDITLGAWVEYWRRRNPPGGDLGGELPAPHHGWGGLEIDAPQRRVWVRRGPVHLDLGGFGKGCALDRMREVLLEWDVDNFLLVSGQSTLLATGQRSACPPKLDERRRKGRGQQSEDSDQPSVVRNPKSEITDPTSDFGPRTSAFWQAVIVDPRDGVSVIERLNLGRRALSASGIRKGPHVIDPRSGEAVKCRLAAWSLATDAGTADALSTAFMIMTVDEIRAYCEGHSGVAALIVDDVERSSEVSGIHHLNWPRQDHGGV